MRPQFRLIIILGTLYLVFFALVAGSLFAAEAVKPEKINVIKVQL